MKIRTTFRKWTFKVVLFLIIVCILPFYALSARIRVVSSDYALNTLNRTLTLQINEFIYGRISELGLGYEDIAQIQRDNGGKISAIVVDSARLNKIAASFSGEIIGILDNIDYREIGIPIGNILNSPLFSGRGPKISLRIVPRGKIASDIKSSFLSAGINQTLHRINVDFVICISALSPFSETTDTIKTSICIAETIIVGEVPRIIWNS